VTDSPVDENHGETPPEEVEGAAVSEEQEKRLIDKAVEAAKAVALEIVETVTGRVPEETPEETPPETTPEPTTAKGVEDDLESKVREAVHKIGAEEQHAKDHERLAKEAERTPIQLGRVTRFLWGGGSDD